MIIHDITRLIVLLDLQELKMEWKKKSCQVLGLLIITSVILIAAASHDQYAGATLGTEVFDPWSVQTSCVRIQADGHYGSGSLLEVSENELIIVTNRHVLQYWNEDSYVTFFNGASCGGEVLWLSEEADIGFLKANLQTLSEEEKRDLQAIEIAGESPQKGDYFFMIDMASDVWNKKLYEGQILEPKIYIEEFGTDMLYGESCFSPGMSGCGIFDMQGRYIGMLTGGTQQNEIAAVPADAIK